MSPAKVQTDSRLFAYSRLDAIPVLAALAHFSYVIFLFLAFKRLSVVGAGSAGARLLGQHLVEYQRHLSQFPAQPLFQIAGLNRCFSVMESVTMGFSQVFYTNIHKWHHVGNADLPDERGHTTDPLSIYKHGENGKPENAWTYVFLSYFRDDPKQIFRDIHRLSPRDAWWGVAEIAAFVCFFAMGFILNWKFMLYFLPFYYFGHCLSYLNGYYLHLGGNPDVPIAWGVSSYHKLYNWLWFNNGYHAEHHYRPRMHWTLMSRFHEEIAEQQKAAKVRVIKPPHALGFLDAGLRRDLRESDQPTPVAPGVGSAPSRTQPS